MEALLLLAALGAGFFLLKGKSGDGNASPAGSMFDANLPPDLQSAVVFAVQGETDPQKLRAFEQALLPEFPQAAAMIEAAARRRDQMNAAAAATR